MIPATKVPRKVTKMSDGTRLKQVELTESKYFIRHVNFGNDDGTPSSKFEIPFSCFDYSQAREILDLVVERTGYKSTKLVLSSKSPQHLPHITELSYEDAAPDLVGGARQLPTKEGGGVLIRQFVDKSVIVWRGRIHGSNGISSGQGYITLIPTSDKRIFLFDKEKSPIGSANAGKLELILEVNVMGDSKWISGKYVNFQNTSSMVFLKGLLELFKHFEVHCPQCQNSCYVERLVRELEDEIYCGSCKNKFYAALFE